MGEKHLFTAISVDSLEWTQHWLGTRRCDLLGVFIAADATVKPVVRVVAVESKTSGEVEPLQLRPDVPPFDEAVEQVSQTLDALDEVLCPEAGSSLFADLKLAALFEHLTSEVLARIHPVKAGDTAKYSVVNALSRLSRRELVCEDGLALDGLVVVTQHLAMVTTSSRTIEWQGSRRTWRLKLVRCGVPALRELFEQKGLTALLEAGLIAEQAPLPEAAEPVGSVGDHMEEEPGGGRPTEVTLDSVTRDRIGQLEAACRLRGFRIGDIAASHVREGPTLVSVSVELAAGESLRPIQAAAKDIARELGVASIVAENDPNLPYYVRFLVPRPERVFPPIPSLQLPAVEPDRQQYLDLWLGAEVDGTPYQSAISEWPHLLVAGTTGSGKTTFMKSILAQLNRLEEGAFQVAIVDGKGEYDYLDFISAEHFVPRFPEVLLGHDRATDVLRWLVEEEIDSRRKILTGYFRANPQAPKSPKQAYIEATVKGVSFPLRPIVVFVDEFAEIMLASGSTADEFERLVQRTVQAGRSALVHLVLATQRPDANVLPGAIKANLPSRVALALPTYHDSMTVLGSAGAEDLLGRGDLLFEPSSGGRIRLQGYRP